MCFRCFKKRSVEDKLYMFRINRAREQAFKDFDLLNIVKSFRHVKTQLKTLLTKSEQKMAKRISDRAIQQETSSSGFPDFIDATSKPGKDGLQYMEDITTGFIRPPSRRLFQLFIE